MQGEERKLPFSDISQAGREPLEREGQKQTCICNAEAFLKLPVPRWQASAPTEVGNWSSLAAEPGNAEGGNDGPGSRRPAVVLLRKTAWT